MRKQYISTQYQLQATLTSTVYLVSERGSFSGGSATEIPVPSTLPLPLNQHDSATVVRESKETFCLFWLLVRKDQMTEQ